MNFDIVEVTDQALLDRFVQFPFELYKNSKSWVPPLRQEEKNYLMEVPKLDDAIRTKMLLALDSGQRVLGRIQITINENEIKHFGVKMARFNKFDFIDAPKISSALIESSENWLKSNGIKKIIGPFGYSNLDPAGLLVDGFDETPNAGTIYNHPYAKAHLLESGYQPYLDWTEYEFNVPEEIPDKIKTFSAMIKKRYKLHTTSFKTRKEKEKRSREILDLIDVCYPHLPGFVPLSDVLKEYYFKKYMPLVHRDYVSLVVDKSDRLIGFGLTIPSYSRALQKAKGSLFPFGFYHLWKANRKNNRAEMLLIAIHPDYQLKGITTLIFEQIMEQYHSIGVTKIDSNPQQMENFNVRNLWKDYDFRMNKKRVCFQKELQTGT